MKKFINAKITSISEELRVFKAQIVRRVPSTGRKRRFVDLEGIWKGKADFSFEEIKEAKIKMRKGP